LQVKPTRIGVKNLAHDQCPRRIYLEILAKMKGINPKVEKNQYIIAGNILHLILQRTFKKNFANIEYFYYRKKMSLDNAIKEAMIEELNFITDLYVKSKGQWEATELIFGIERANEYLPNLAEFASKYLVLEKNLKNCRT